MSSCERDDQYSHTMIFRAGEAYCVSCGITGECRGCGWEWGTTCLDAEVTT